VQKPKVRRPAATTYKSLAATHVPKSGGPSLIADISKTASR
jgi:hypothetical protein